MLRAHLRLAGAAALGLACALWLAGCSTTPTTPFDDPDTPAAAANPDGLPYPTDHIGTRARTKVRVGDRLANFAFQGYLDGDPKGALKTLSMADLYDPEAKRSRLLHIQGVAGWCPVCASEAKQTRTAASELRAEGAVIIQVLMQGAKRSVGPSLADLETWCDTYETKHAVLLDVDGRRLGVFGIDGFPWNALVDTRTMEILDQGIGAPRDVAAYVREGLRLANGPPATY
ncbi:MAG TPA: redoxin domain-containing protein [Polyangiaceae bacterium]|nr:redoxin domain-containing protein [Polyangiaceae bacterium]